MPADYWGDKLRGKLTARIAASAAAIQARLGPPVVRKPNTKDILNDALIDPSLYSDAASQKQLVDRLFETYGEAARFVAPYAFPDQVPEGGIPEEPYIDEGFADGTTSEQPQTSALFR